MEIAPIPGIRAVPVVRAPQDEMRAPVVFDIDPSSKPGDDTRQQTRRKAVGAEEHEDDDLAPEGETSDGGEALEEPAARQVDYFA
jgi:hypothetical protein